MVYFLLHCLPLKKQRSYFHEDNHHHYGSCRRNRWNDNVTGATDTIASGLLITEGERVLALPTLVRSEKMTSYNPLPTPKRKGFGWYRHRVV